MLIRRVRLEEACCNFIPFVHAELPLHAVYPAHLVTPKIVFPVEKNRHAG